MWANSTSSSGAPKPPMIGQAWTVPAFLLCAILIALILHFPVYLGLSVGCIWAMFFAKMHLHSWGRIWKALFQGIWAMWKVCLVLLFVGIVVALWMTCGTIPYLMQIGAGWIHPGNIIYVSFLLAALLSMIIGSSIATWSVLAPPLMVLAPSSMTWMVAGALVSGGMVGDRASPMSTSVIVMSTTAEIPYENTLKKLNTSNVLPVMLTLLSFVLLNVTQSASTPITSHTPLSCPSTSWWLSLPPIVVIILALCRIPLVFNLGFAMILATEYAFTTTHGASLTILRDAWNGFSLQSGTHLAEIGGLFPMCKAVLLIVSAGAFQGVATLGGAIDVLATSAFTKVKSWGTFTAVTYTICIGFTALVGSQMLAVLMSGNTLKARFDERGYPRTWLLRIVSDAAELPPAVIPWNLLGLQAGLIIGIPTEHWIGFAWFIWFSLLISVFHMASRFR